MMKALARVVAVFIGLGLSLAPLAVAQDAPRELVVFAASSLTDAFTEIGAAFEAENPGVRVLFSFGSSSDLAVQLTQGAPADVFASANIKQMTAADQGGVPRAFAFNRLALIVPSDNPADIHGVEDLDTPGIALVVAATGVPIRAYTDTLIGKMAADPAHGAAYQAGVQGNIVSEEQNVRLIAAKVALGEADAGIVYFSDVTPDIADSVQIFSIPSGLDVLAIYPIVAIHASAQPDLAAAFVDFVVSEPGQATLARWNFIRAR